MRLTSEQQQEFKDKGLLIMPGFFAAPVVRKISTWLDELQWKTPAPGEEARYYEESIHPGKNILVRIEHVLGEHNSGPTRLLLNTEVMEVLQDLFGEPALLFKDKVNYKLPGCRADKLHQDQAAGWSAYADFFISVGVVIDSARRDNAALSFMKSGNYERALITEEWSPLSEADPPYQPEDEYMLLEAEPGDVVFFDCYVPHGSPANTSERSRRILFLTFNGASAGDMRKRYYEDKWRSYPPNEAAAARSSATFRV